MSGPIPAQLLDGLNPQQAQAVTTLDGPLLMVAGPGSGKTRALTHRIAALVATGVPPYRILAVTFTNKAAKEMRSRLDALVGAEATDSMWVATFHAACVRMLRLHHQAANLPRSFTIVDADDSRKLLKAAARTEGLLEGLTPQEEKDFVKDAAAAISIAKNDGRTVHDLEASPFSGPMYAQVWRAYAARLASMGALDFDDILVRAATLLRTNEQVATWAHNRFTHVLVDEYQDTNRIQEAITQHWAFHCNLCVVGDPDQSIYAFRGAAPAVMTVFTAHYPEAKVLVLERNYRSTANICAVSRAVIAANPALHRAQTHTLAAAGDPVLLHTAANSEGEAAWVVDRIRDRGGDWTDHAILLRTIALSRPVENALRRAGIPYVIVGGQSFYDRAEIKDAVAWLRLASNHDDELAFARASGAPKRGLGSTTVNLVSSFAREHRVDLLTACQEVAATTPRASKALLGFIDDVRSVHDAADDGVESAVRAVLGPVGLRAHVRAVSDKDGLDRQENLDGLLEEARTFDTSPRVVDVEGKLVMRLPGHERLVAFIENATLTSETLEEATRDSGQGRVQLMTIHAAKGKEFSHVTIVGLEENVLPHARSIATGQPEDIQEERRLAFVAVSRAQQTLALTHCRTRFWFGDEVSNAPSRFLDELPMEVILASSELVPWSAHSAQTPGVRRGVPLSSAARLTSPSLMGRPLPPSQPAAPDGPMMPLALGQSVEHRTLGPGVVVALDNQYVSIDIAGSVRVFDRQRVPLVPAEVL